MQLIPFTWFRIGRVPKPARRRHGRRSAPRHLIAVESLEVRSVPSINSVLNAGALEVSSSVGDPITLGTDAKGQVTLNGTDLQTPNGATIPASTVTSLTVTGSPASDVIDLSGLTLAAFSSLNQLNVNGSSGDDLIVSSPFANTFAGSSGTPPSAIDVNQGFELVVAGTGSILEPSDPQEVRSAGHFSWERQPASTTNNTPASTSISNIPAVNSLLASTTFSGQNTPVMSRGGLNWLSSPSSLDTSTPPRELRYAEGLIDLNAAITSKSARHAKSNLSLPESVVEPREDGLIAARVATPNRNSSRFVPTNTRAVPTPLPTRPDDGFIELAAAVAPLVPRRELLPTTNLARHDQLDADLGRVRAFGDADFLDQMFAATPVSKVAAVELTTEHAPLMTPSSHWIEWTVAATSGLATLMFPAKTNRRWRRSVFATITVLRRCRTIRTNPSTTSMAKNQNSCG